MVSNLLCTILGECMALWGKPNEPIVYSIMFCKLQYVATTDANTLYYGLLLMLTGLKRKIKCSKCSYVAKISIKHSFISSNVFNVILVINLNCF